MMSGARADFASTRHQLDQLGYHQHLSKDCVDLVAVILGDLITTTNTCKQYQSELDSKQSQLEIIKNMDNPLQYELDRLTIENNRLHRDIVKVRNEKEVAEKESEQTLRELKQKNQQLLLLNSQLKRDNALEKSKQVIGNQNLEMELGSTRPLSPITNQSLNQNVVSDTVNLLKLSEQSRAALQDELDKMRKKTYHLESELKSLNEQIISSDNNAKVSLHLRNPNLQELQRAKDRINLLESHVQVLQEHLDEVDRGSKSKSPIKFCDCADERARNAQLCLKIKEMEELLQVAENKLSKSKYTPVKKPVPLKKQSQITPKKPKPSKNEAKLSSSIIEEQIDDNEKLTKRIEDLEMSLKTMVFKNETLDQKLQDMKIERNRIQKKFHGCEKERDTLLKAFEKFESDLDKVQKKVKSISKEKDHYRYLYQSTMRDFNKGKLAINKSKTDLEHKLEKLRDENKSLLEKIENSKNPISNDKDAVRLQKELQQQNLELIESNKLRDEIFRQREQIQNELDTTVGRLNELEFEHQMVKKRNIWLETQCSETKKELDRTIKHSAVQSQEITDLKQVSNDQSIQISSYEATCASFQQENERLSHDLTALVKENQYLAQEMQSNSQTMQILNRQIEELDQKNNSLHKDLLLKDDEKHQLMVQYRKLINERESDEKNLRRALEEANHCRYMIITSLDLIMIEKKLGTTESELEALRHDCNNLKTDLAYQERQNSECRGSLALTERKLSDCELDKQRLHRELLSVRELLNQVDREREDLKSQLVRMSPGEDANDRPQSWIIERETLLLELSEVRSKVVQLENTLSDLRRKEASPKKLLGETTAETERLNSLEANLRLQAADLQGKKELISKLDATIAVLRRENQEKQNVISDLLSVRQAENETVESKIFSELQDTQRERRLATSQLAEQQDQSKRLNLDLRILDTLARNQGNQDD